jgi:hypothetical protein
MMPTRCELLSQAQEDIGLLRSDLDQADATPLGDLGKLLDQMAVRAAHIDRLIDALAAAEAEEVA